MVSSNHFYQLPNKIRTESKLQLFGHSILFVFLLLCVLASCSGNEIASQKTQGPDKIRGMSEQRSVDTILRFTVLSTKEDVLNNDLELEVSNSIDTGSITHLNFRLEFLKKENGTWILLDTQSYAPVTEIFRAGENRKLGLAPQDPPKDFDSLVFRVHSYEYYRPGME